MRASMPVPPMTPDFNLDPPRDKKLLRRQLQAERMALPDRLERAVQLQEVLRVWLVGRARPRSAPTGRSRASSTRCRRCIAGPKARSRASSAASACRWPTATTKRLRFHVWYPGCPMEHDAYDIPKPKDTDPFEPAAAGGALPRLRPGRRAPGLWRRLLRPHAGDACSRGRSRSAWATRTASCRCCAPSRDDVPLDAMLTEDGVMWGSERRARLSLEACSARPQALGSSLDASSADLVHRVEVQARRAAGDAAARTARVTTSSPKARIEALSSPKPSSFSAHPARDVDAVARRRTAAICAKLLIGMMPGTTGTSAPSLRVVVDEAEVGVGVEEELRDRRVGAGLHLVDVGLQVALRRARLRVHLGIGRDLDVAVARPRLADEARPGRSRSGTRRQPPCRSAGRRAARRCGGCLRRGRWPSMLAQRRRAWRRCTTGAARPRSLRRGSPARCRSVFSASSRRRRR